RPGGASRGPRAGRIAAGGLAMRGWRAAPARGRRTRHGGAVPPRPRADHAFDPRRGHRWLSGSTIFATAVASTSARLPLFERRPTSRAFRRREPTWRGAWFTPAGASRGRDASRVAKGSWARGGPTLCDSEMVAHGVTRARLPAQNEVVCTLHDPRVARLAEDLHTTRSAAALDLWRDRLGGAVVAIGNAPTALFRLLEML